MYLCKLIYKARHNGDLELLFIPDFLYYIGITSDRAERILNKSNWNNISVPV